MSGHSHLLPESASVGKIDDTQAVMDLYFARFNVRLDSQYAYALQTLPVSLPQKVELLHDVLLLTDFVLDSLPESGLLISSVSQ